MDVAAAAGITGDSFMADEGTAGGVTVVGDDRSIVIVAMLRVGEKRSSLIMRLQLYKALLSFSLTT